MKRVVHIALNQVFKTSCSVGRASRWFHDRAHRLVDGQIHRQSLDIYQNQARNLLIKFRLYLPRRNFMSVVFQNLKANQKHFSDDMRTLVNDAEALLTHAVSDAGTGYDDARNRLEKSLKSARAELAGAEQAVLERARQAKKATDEYVHVHPWESVGVGTGLGAAVGFLLGMLISRR
jgi:ElaB/YqjD/DUF883 family membrane-anchored ribosome-binding protein